MEFSETYKGYTIEIEQDTCPTNPIQEYDGNVKYALFHRNYDFQNDTDLSSGDFSSWAEMKKAIQKKYKTLAILPIYLYDHSGITMATTSFSCRWDSGQIGFAFINKEVLNNWGWKSRKKFEKAAKETLEDAIVSNVKLYDDYVRGNVYGYIVKDPEGEEVDSCWGYFGDLGKESAISEAESVVNGELRYSLKAKLNKLKTLIKYSVPLQYRELILTQIN